MKILCELVDVASASALAGFASATDIERDDAETASQSRDILLPEPARKGLGWDEHDGAVNSWSLIETVDGRPIGHLEILHYPTPRTAYKATLDTRPPEARSDSRGRHFRLVRSDREGWYIVLDKQEQVSRTT